MTKSFGESVHEAADESTRGYFSTSMVVSKGRCHYEGFTAGANFARQLTLEECRDERNSLRRWYHDNENAVIRELNAKVAELRNLREKSEGLLKALENFNLFGGWRLEHNISHQDVDGDYVCKPNCTRCDAKLKASEAIAKFKEESK